MSFISHLDRVVLIEDDFVIRESYRMIINDSNKFCVVGDYSSYEEASSFIKKINPKIILMDIGLPGLSGIEATRIIKAGNPLIEVIIVSIFEDDEFVFKALKNGASGYISKTSNPSQLISALEEVRRGGAPMSSKIARLLIEDLHLDSVSSPLLQEEVNILITLAEGRTHMQIAENFGLSRGSLKAKIRTIYEKLHVTNKSEAIQAGINQRII